MEGHSSWSACTEKPRRRTTGQASSLTRSPASCRLAAAEAGIGGCVRLGHAYVSVCAYGLRSGRRVSVGFWLCLVCACQRLRRGRRRVSVIGVWLCLVCAWMDEAGAWLIATRETHLIPSMCPTNRVLRTTMQQRRRKGWTRTATGSLAPPRSARTGRGSGRGGRSTWTVCACV